MKPAAGHNAYADVPDKIHVFYEQAFDTLFARHDSQKESFTRQFHSGLKIDEFKIQFAYFCLLTYDYEAYEFSETRILELLKESKQFSGANYDESLFLKDLLDAVCMLQWDGLTIVFSHRSFQEFFTSYLLVRMDYKVTGELVERYLSRPSEVVIGMFYDMNKEAAIESFLRPKYSQFESQLTFSKETVGSIKKFCEHFKCRAEVMVLVRHLSIDKSVKNIRAIHIHFPKMEAVLLIRFLRAIGAYNTGDIQIKSFGSLDFIESQPFIDACDNLFAAIPKLRELEVNGHSLEIYNGTWKWSPDEIIALESFFLQSGWGKFHLARMEAARDTCIEILSKSDDRRSSLRALLSLKSA